MNCQEVMEFMQRQLDGDLNAKEEIELHAHLMHCLDCAQMFERLQRLSDELTQLPKVIPPYSLVDAIMPQLADIDRHAAASITDKVAAFGTSANQSASMQPPKLPWTRRLGLQFSWKFAGGVVAAGLILGFFAFNLKHPVLDQADGLLQPRSNKQSAGQMQSTAASDSNVAQDAAKKNAANSADAKQAAPNTPAAAGSVGQGKAPQPEATAGNGLVGPQATTDANLEEPKTLSSSGTTKGTDGLRQAPSTSEPERLKDPASAGSNVKKETDPASTNPPTDSKVPEEQKVLKTTDSTPTPAAKKGGTTSDVGGIYSLTAPVSANPLKSATGVLEAVVEEQHVVIRNSSTKEVVFASKQVWKSGDLITLVEWSKDDKLFYQVQSEGSLQTFLIDLNAKEEAAK
ncbi:zf-HC2 domain-containing protein [Paenibacillus alginolyticus]|uniref:Zf-HC2 domain-containing protein n=1 Tax=Paenibacillus alginolyticus TaxID=59839 RepID=A0ABT4GI91_9BACL|nr:zf-HC2 domain-containing protein [Paenibacillus alginolyticus]MCY9695841.1 zf-HC2 domain-containing protein [Paenibacillus alginolyticus]MEC0148658.1 zf-HC2 domain-containing protein [Paenibacillus alginolyticus]